MCIGFTERHLLIKNNYFFILQSLPLSFKKKRGCHKEMAFMLNAEVMSTLLELPRGIS